MIRRWLRCGARAAFTTGVFARGLASQLRAPDASSAERAAAMSQVFRRLAEHHRMMVEVEGEPPPEPCVL
ncbi:MAG TPA: hypothetical protein VEL05_07375, partial [Candidatus Acidoferrum sp.]|nr:hypothetical protein [Candidatus Acidoferrum sp.]